MTPLKHSIPVYLVFPNDHSKISKQILLNLLRLESRFMFLSIGYGEYSKERDSTAIPKFNLNFENFTLVENFFNKEARNKHFTWKEKILDNIPNKDESEIFSSKYLNKNKSIIVLFLDKSSLQNSYNFPKNQVVLPILIENTDLPMNKNFGDIPIKILDDDSAMHDFFNQLTRVIIVHDPWHMVESDIGDGNLYFYWQDKNSPLHLTKYLSWLKSKSSNSLKSSLKEEEGHELSKDIKGFENGWD
jgi:hypothetical protein